MQQDLISCAQAAKRLGIHVSTVRGWARGGRFPVYRHGQRFIRLDWKELLQALVDVDKPQAEHGRKETATPADDGLVALP